MIDLIKSHEFNKAIDGLGVNQLFINTPSIEHIVETSFYIENDPFVFETVIFEYKNPLQFIFEKFAAVDLNIAQIEYLINKLNVNTTNKVYEVEFHTSYKRYPKEYSVHNRKYMLYRYLESAKTMLANGVSNIKLYPGDVVAAYPHGYKINMGPVLKSTQLGIKNREYLLKYLSLGKKDVYGWCYGIYNEDLKLMPL